MRKLFLSVGCSFVFSMSVAQMQISGQDQVQSESSIPAQGTSMESYGDIAALSQKIALSERKIQAVQLQNDLETLEQQQLLGNFPFKVQHIEGFNDVLYAVIVDDKGTQYHLEPGAVFADHYRISLIRPTAVGVVDLSTHRFYTVPFLIGGVDTVMEGVPASEVTASTQVTPSSTTTAASSRA